MKRVLVNSAFHTTDPQTFESRTIFVGTPSDDENCTEVGLIINKDTENCDHILTYLSHYAYLNDICMLFKPNNERLTVSFRFCFKELLTHLHINAKDNLMFIFTNGRASFYRPGSTTPLIRKLLAEVNETWHVEVPFNTGNSFMFDNEAFRFLALYKNGMRFAVEEVQNSVDSSNVFSCVIN